MYSKNNLKYTVVLFHVLVVGVTCHFGGTCVSHDEDGSMGFHCLCESGFTGLLCERKIDNCADMPCSDIGMSTTNHQLH